MAYHYLQGLVEYSPHPQIQIVIHLAKYICAQVSERKYEYTAME